uniref:Uncharacterized protein n=1 Tax=Grammatophora oceanica TaxID=210454 RepID=A0A7S1VSB3_9STRA|mmetsp:Transcript_53404/g.79777  ORF Transcript_53404/g.79777 Transcript_53404/m.79777 type:complete len:758 (+) Transcript_53404:92-2365(+)|eukprot:CAMPEP_0194043838 /NCGR_PEP_ID=MMETSP0009_2-20130614/15406_1 /TAXON_ID=210454 /ORGANISM="Grammatophora oceanica, Strain CCMP 410" /LENGTH=757 /DNA_ID=CAMNT_0038688189 /DNA_START=95 /DNA_END=2371 /DNA_ORIENTATION=+
MGKNNQRKYGHRRRKSLFEAKEQDEDEMSARLVFSKRRGLRNKATSELDVVIPPSRSTSEAGSANDEHHAAFLKDMLAAANESRGPVMRGELLARHASLPPPPPPPSTPPNRRRKPQSPTKSPPARPSSARRSKSVPLARATTEIGAMGKSSSPLRRSRMRNLMDDTDSLAGGAANSDHTSSSTPSETSARKHYITNMDEIDLMKQLTAQAPTPASGSPSSQKQGSQNESRRSRRSRSCPRTVRRPPARIARGDSLEREVSRTILQTAAAGVHEAHFLINPGAAPSKPGKAVPVPVPFSKPPPPVPKKRHARSMSFSTKDILMDLMNQDSSKQREEETKSNDEIDSPPRTSRTTQHGVDPWLRGMESSEVYDCTPDDDDDDDHEDAQDTRSEARSVVEALLCEEDSEGQEDTATCFTDGEKSIAEALLEEATDQEDSDVAFEDPVRDDDSYDNDDGFQFTVSAPTTAAAIGKAKGPPTSAADPPGVKHRSSRRKPQRQSGDEESSSGSALDESASECSSSYRADDDSGTHISQVSAFMDNNSDHRLQLAQQALRNSVPSYYGEEEARDPSPILPVDSTDAESMTSSSVPSEVHEDEPEPILSTPDTTQDSNDEVNDDDNNNLFSSTNFAMEGTDDDDGDEWTSFGDSPFDSVFQQPTVEALATRGGSSRGNSPDRETAVNSDTTTGTLDTAPSLLSRVTDNDKLIDPKDLQPDSPTSVAKLGGFGPTPSTGSWEDFDTNTVFPIILKGRNGQEMVEV